MWKYFYIALSREVDVHFTVYKDSMEHRAASLVGQKLAAAQLIYGDSVEGALIEQSDSGHGFLADLARSVIEGADVPDLGSLFRQVSLGGNGKTTDEFINADPMLQSSVAAEIEQGCVAALSPQNGLANLATTRQMALF